MMETYRHIQISADGIVIADSQLSAPITDRENLYYIPDDDLLPDGFTFGWRRVGNEWLPPLPPTTEQLEAAKQVAKSTKLAEIAADCETAIFAGVDVVTSRGNEHFALTLNDQTNLANLALQAQSGAAVLYHADGELCRVFAPEELLAVVAASIRHKTYHTTRCNHVNVWVRRTDDEDEFSAIRYDSPLPDDLAASMAELLGTGGGDGE